MDATSVRVDATLLRKHKGGLVRIIGKCEKSDPDGNKATLICNGPIELVMADEIFQVGKIYEVIGKANAETLEVTTFSLLELSDNTSVEIALKLANYIDKVPELYMQQ